MAKIDPYWLCTIDRYGNALTLCDGGYTDIENARKAYWILRSMGEIKPKERYGIITVTNLEVVQDEKNLVPTYGG